MASAESRSKLPAPDTQESDRLKDGRGHHRIPAAAPAMLISSALGRVRASVTDISRSGCRISTRVRCHVGDHYVLRIADVGPRSVKVIWHRDEAVGLMFAEPLCWTIVSEIVFGGPMPVE